MLAPAPCTSHITTLPLATSRLSLPLPPSTGAASRGATPTAARRLRTAWAVQVLLPRGEAAGRVVPLGAWTGAQRAGESGLLIVDYG